MNYVVWRRKTSCALPPDKDVLVDITPTVTLAWIVDRCKHQFVWTILHVAMIAQIYC